MKFTQQGLALSSSKGFAHILIILLLLVGLVVAVYLVGQQTNLFSKASNSPIVFKDVSGKVLPVVNGVAQSPSLDVIVELTSTLGSPVSVSSPRSGTASYRVASNPADLNKANFSPYLKEPTILKMELQKIKGVEQFYWVEFKSVADKNPGRTDRRSAQIRFMPTPISPPLIPTPYPSRVFVTSTTSDGNLGGLSGADSKCQTRANAANLGGVWKAWLSDSTTSAASRLVHNTYPYKSLDGKIIANNWADLTDGTLQNDINITEKGVRSDHYVWSNTKINGEMGRSGDVNLHCDNWTSNSYYNAGSPGATGKKDKEWTEAGFSSMQCYVPGLALYCFEQGSAVTPTPTIPPVPTPTMPPSPTEDVISSQIINLTPPQSSFTPQGSATVRVDILSLREYFSDEKNSIQFRLSGVLVNLIPNRTYAVYVCRKNVNECDTNSQPAIKTNQNGNAVFSNVKFNADNRSPYQAISFLKVFEIPDPGLIPPDSCRLPDSPCLQASYGYNPLSAPRSLGFSVNAFCSPSHAWVNNPHIDLVINSDSNLWSWDPDPKGIITVLQNIENSKKYPLLCQGTRVGVYNGLAIHDILFDTYSLNRWLKLQPGKNYKIQLLSGSDCYGDLTGTVLKEQNFNVSSCP